MCMSICSCCSFSFILHLNLLALYHPSTKTSNLESIFNIPLCQTNYQVLPIFSLRWILVFMLLSSKYCCLHSNLDHLVLTASVISLQPLFAQPSEQSIFHAHQTMSFPGLKSLNVSLFAWSHTSSAFCDTRFYKEVFS